MNHFLTYCWEMLQTSGAWLVLSFIICGILHALLRPETLQKSLGNKKFSSIIKATLSGMLLPVCSCGVVPLALGLYYSGAYLGPTLAFLVSTPITNPAAIILAYAMLGPEIATIYLISGFVLPVIVGVIGNKFAGKELVSPVFAKIAQTGDCQPIATISKQPLFERLKGGMIWGFQDLAVQTCRYILAGTLFASLLLSIFSTGFITQYLSSPKIISLIGVTLLSAIMYVCALGHIPFIAALVSAGAAPGVAITFLIAGVATNVPEMVSIFKLIGKRTVVFYTGLVVLLGIGIGYLTNIILADKFVPQFDLSKSEKTISFARSLTLDFPDWFKTFCAIIILGIGVYAWFTHFRQKLKQRRNLA